MFHDLKITGQVIAKGAQRGNSAANEKRRPLRLVDQKKKRPLRLNYHKKNEYSNAVVSASQDSQRLICVPRKATITIHDQPKVH